jgi:hypothetical protein
MNFKTIKSYWNYDAYQRIKRIKALQKHGNHINKKNPNSYQEYLNKISGFKCCCKQPTCNGCCTYSLDGCCKNGTSQTYVSTSTECVCFNGMMLSQKGGDDSNVLHIGNLGYNDISGVSGETIYTYTPFGTLSPKETCEGLTINSIATEAAGPAPDPTGLFSLQVTFSGPTWSGTFFTCIILTQGNKKIVVYRKDAPPPHPATWTLNDSTYYTYKWWIKSQLTEGTWCVELKI